MGQSLTPTPPTKYNQHSRSTIEAAPMQPLRPASVALVATLPPPSDIEPVDSVTPVKPDDETGDDGEARGVIRLLEAGHFKGVADVRLRINFFEELSARAAANAAPVAEKQSHELTDAVAARIDELLKPLATDEIAVGAIEAAAGDFNDAVASAVGDAVSGLSLDGDGLTGAIQSAFDEMVSRMRELLTAPAPEAPPPTDLKTEDRTAAGILAIPSFEPVSVDGTDTVVTDVSEPATDAPAPEPSVTLDDAIESLSAAFTEALAKLVEAIDSATTLPDPSAPRNGNGSAYDKFLAIYNDLRGITSAVDQTA